MTMKLIRVFVDSDVVIASLMSTTGAADMLLHNTEGIELYVSNFSVEELERVVSRLKLDQEKLHKLLNTRFSFVKINQPLKKIREEFADYIRDINDAHIVAGAKEAKVTYIVTYNIRHFETNKLSQDFQIILLTPGLFLQYLRSL